MSSRRDILRQTGAGQRFRDGEDAVSESVRLLVLDVLAGHSPELRPYWDDLVAEVCFQAWRRACEATEPIRDLEAFVARITHARVIDLHRRRSRWRYDSRPDSFFGKWADSGKGPYRAVVRGDRERRVAELMARADERTRRIWKAIYFDGLKYREAAEELGMPEGTLKRLVHESLRWAAKTLEGQDGDGARNGESR